MSTKFNRNDTNAADDKFYIGDYQTDLNSIEQDLLDAIKQFETLPCIISGLTLIPQAYPSIDIQVSSGSARDKDGKPVILPSSSIVQMVNTSGGNNYVILMHKDSEDTPRKAYETGTEYNTRKYDDFELSVAETYSSGDIILGNVKREGNQNVLYSDERTPDVAKPFACVPSPKPTRLTLTTGWDDDFRKNGAAAGLVSTRPAFIKAEFGDKGTGTASGNTFTWSTNRVGNWTTNEWAGQYLSCADGNTWRVVSNTTTTLTLEVGAMPVSGSFYLGPNAAGYRFVIKTLDPDTDEEIARAESEAHAATTPVLMEYIWHNLTSDIKYSVQIASKGSWFQKDWSDFCSAQTITAGGPKEIPDDCAATIKNVVVSADDDGIRIVWDIESGYTDKVAGVEIVYTDDGTTPDFDNKGHRKIYTDRKNIVLPARITTDDTTYTVKAKLRAVDRGGRHCTTPITITPVATKKYPADLSALVSDYKNIITPGNFPSLATFLSQSVNLADGRGKQISELESVMSDLQGDFESPAKRFEALAGAAIVWKYVRVVAKDGTGQYSTIQSAINSIPATDPNHFWTILILPGTYSELVNLGTKFQSADYALSFIGIGRVLWYGGLKSDASDNAVRIANIESIRFYQPLGTPHSIPCLTIKGSGVHSAYIRNCSFVVYSTNASIYPIKAYGDASPVVISNCEIISYSPSGCIRFTTINGTNTGWLVIKNCYFYKSGGGQAVYIITSGGTHYLYVKDSDLRTGTGNACIDADAGNQSTTFLYMAHCRYVAAPNATNITCDYGTLENVSNILYGQGDFCELQEAT